MGVLKRSPAFLFHRPVSGLLWMSGIESGQIVPNRTVYVFDRAVTPSHRQQNLYINRLCDAWLVFVRQLECHPDVAFLTQLIQRPSEVDIFIRMEPPLRLSDLLGFVLKPLVGRILMLLCVLDGRYWISSVLNASHAIYLVLLILEQGMCWQAVSHTCSPTVHRTSCVMCIQRCHSGS